MATNLSVFSSQNERKAWSVPCFLRTKRAINIPVSFLFLCTVVLSTGCATSNLPADAYANRTFTPSDMATFLKQGPMEAKFRQLNNGMSKDEVIQMIGEPDRIDRAAGASEPFETLVYLGRFLSGWSWERADYKVELREGKVTGFSKGPDTTQPHPTIFYIPIMGGARP